MCSPVAQPDTAPCTQAGNTGECLSAPGHLPRLQERERERRPPGLLLPGRHGRQPGQHHRRSGPGRRDDLQQALLRSELQRSGEEERLDQPLLGPRAGEPGRERQARLQHDPHRRDELRLPVHRLEPRHQRRPRPGLRDGAEPDHRPHLHRRRQRPPDVPRSGAGRHQRHHVRPVVGRRHVDRRRALGRHPGDARHHRRPVPVLEPGELGDGRLLPARSDRPTASRSTRWRRWARARRPDGRDGADVVQPVALLAQHRRIRRGATCAAATSTCSRPA